MSAVATDEAPAQRIEESLATIAACGNRAAVEASRALVQAVLAMHRAGLSRMLELTQRHGEPARALLEELASDDLVSNLLLLHDLHPVGLDRRLAAALAEARPRVAELGGAIDGYTIEAGGIEVRIGGLTAASLLMAARMTVEEVIIKYAPDVAAITFAGSLPQRELPAPEPPALVTLRIPQAARQNRGQPR